MLDLRAFLFVNYYFDRSLGPNNHNKKCLDIRFDKVFVIVVVIRICCCSDRDCRCLTVQCYGLLSKTGFWVRIVEFLTVVM